tara:strand:+ start:1030 stop:1323 length:294 start_codon:yes stop_codon:yes gene_type:complete
MAPEEARPIHPEWGFPYNRIERFWHKKKSEIACYLLAFSIAAYPLAFFETHSKLKVGIDRETIEMEAREDGALSYYVLCPARECAYFFYKTNELKEK